MRGEIPGQESGINVSRSIIHHHGHTGLESGIGRGPQTLPPTERVPDAKVGMPKRGRSWPGRVGAGIVVAAVLGAGVGLAEASRGSSSEKSSVTSGQKIKIPGQVDVAPANPPNEIKIPGQVDVAPANPPVVKELSGTERVAEIKKLLLAANEPGLMDSVSAESLPIHFETKAGDVTTHVISFWKDVKINEAALKGLISYVDTQHAGRELIADPFHNGGYPARMEALTEKNVDGKDTPVTTRYVLLLDENQPLPSTLFGSDDISTAGTRKPFSNDGRTAGITSAVRYVPGDEKQIHLAQSIFGVNPPMDVRRAVALLTELGQAYQPMPTDGRKVDAGTILAAREGANNFLGDNLGGLLMGKSQAEIDALANSTFSTKVIAKAFLQSVDTTGLPIKNPFATAA